MKTAHKLMISIFTISIFALSASCNTASPSGIPETPGQITPSNAVSQSPVPITETQPSAEPVTTTATSRSLKITAVTDKASYLPGEKVEVMLSITNNTQDSLTLGNFPPYMGISSQGIVAKTYDSGSQTVKLAPGEAWTYNMSWDQLDSEGKPVHPAIYEISANIVSITRGSSSGIYGEGFNEVGPIVINFPQGFMRKTIDVDQSRTVDGITITLNRIELSDTGMKIYMLKTPGPPQSTVLEPPSLKGIADIQGTYRIDNGDTFETGPFGHLALENSVEYVMEYLYPAPGDAQMLFFSITRISIPDVGSYGPFEFKVPLQ